MPSVCVSLSQIVSHSVSSCVCVSAVAERNSLQGKKRRGVHGRETQGRWDDDDDDDAEQEGEEEEEAEGGTKGLEYDDTDASAALSALLI